MYENYLYKDHTISEWEKLLHYEFSQGELYRMSKEGCDLQLLLLRKAGLATVED